MKAALSKKYIKSRYVGLDIYRARKKILQEFPDLDEERIDTGEFIPGRWRSEVTQITCVWFQII